MLVVSAFSKLFVVPAFCIWKAAVVLLTGLRITPTLEEPPAGVKEVPLVPDLIVTPSLVVLPMVTAVALTVPMLMAAVPMPVCVPVSIVIVPALKLVPDEALPLCIVIAPVEAVVEAGVAKDNV
jgi:hypothetical protein